MPAKIFLPLLLGALTLSAATLATAKAENTHPSANSAEKTFVIDAQPADFANDICWVAPEWRND
jgi:hypothetical protein